jgi:tetratricopeptide (TPR) repeat protein
MTMKNHEHEKKETEAVPPASQERASEVRAADYLRAVRSHLKDGMQQEAFKLLQQASIQFPDEPLVLSYYGCLLAVVDKKYRAGVEACKKAIVILQEKEMFEEDILFPVLYLNLGRAFLASGKKQEAIGSFHDGLQYDRSNAELKKELRSLGTRKMPPVSFLDRMNPINKYIGMLLHKTKASSNRTRKRS